METAMIIEHQPGMGKTEISTAALNRLLAEGWVVKRISPMGGGGISAHVAVIVVLEKL